jgi:hypothetical protein
MAVHIALHEIGAPFERVPMLFKRGDARTPRLQTAGTTATGRSGRYSIPDIHLFRLYCGSPIH